MTKHDNSVNKPSYMIHFMLTKWQCKMLHEVLSMKDCVDLCDSYEISQK